ncbi:MAG: DUF4811 domain-containing protein [Turicibacter sp.]|nr:DUF4811 domain-containing protein [Turicibacter sp.]
MIILLIAVFTFTSFFGLMFIKNRGMARVVGGISLLLLTICTGLLTAHIANHFGMEEVTNSTEHKIFTAGDMSAPYGIVIQKEIGEGSGNFVAIYRDKETDMSPTAHFTPDMEHINEAVKHHASISKTEGEEAVVTVEVTAFEFTSPLMEALFGWGGESGELAHEEATVYVPNNSWVTLSEEQAQRASGFKGTGEAAEQIRQLKEFLGI